MVNNTQVTEKNQRTPFTEQRIITDLVAELAIVLHDKAALESKNAALNLECQELKHKLTNYEQLANEEKNSLIQNFKKSQQMIHEKEITLAEKDVERLQEQKKYLMEIGELKTAHYKQKDLFGKRELELAKEIELLKIKTDEANKSCTTQQKMADIYKNKYIKYKAKVKHAIGIINTLTATLETYKQKPIVFNMESQTETRCRTVYDGCTSLTSLHSQHTTKNENIILTELFFKPHPSNNDIENIFFMSSNESNNH